MGWGILFIFFLGAAAMVTRRMAAMICLPCMSLTIALLVMHQHPLGALSLVFGQGSARLAGAMTNVVFGATLAQVVFSTGIAETIVHKAAELAGDRTRPVAFVLFAATAVGFVALTGLGSVIMTGTLVLPILTGVGIRPKSAAGIFLFAIALGGGWNLANWGLYEDLLKLPVSNIATYAAITNACLLVAGIAYLLIHTRRPRVTWGLPSGADPLVRAKVSGPALLTPLVPVALIFVFKFLNLLTLGHVAGRDFDINAALTIGALYGVWTTRPRGALNTLMGAISEGIASVAPVIGLMIGIGMAVTVLMAPPVEAAMDPVLHAIVPTSPVGYVLFFGLLSPLALYRGPLNLYGLGAGIAVIMTAILPKELVMGALMATGLIQGVCDPTNTHNTWIGEFLGVEVSDVLKSTLPYAFVATFASLLIIAVRAHW